MLVTSRSRTSPIARKLSSKPASKCPFLRLRLVFPSSMTAVATSRTASCPNVSICGRVCCDLRQSEGKDRAPLLNSGQFKRAFLIHGEGGSLRAGSKGLSAMHRFRLPIHRILCRLANADEIRDGDRPTSNTGAF